MEKVQITRQHIAIADNQTIGNLYSGMAWQIAKFHRNSQTPQTGHLFVYLATVPTQFVPIDLSSLF